MHFFTQMVRDKTLMENDFLSSGEGAKSGSTPAPKLSGSTLAELTTALMFALPITPATATALARAKLKRALECEAIHQLLIRHSMSRP